MKKFLIITALILGVAALNATQVEAQRIWCCSYLGKDYFIETDSIYDSRPYYFVDVLTKRADLGQPIVGYDKRQWRFFGIKPTGATVLKAEWSTTNLPRPFTTQ